MRNNKNNLMKRKAEVLLAALAVIILMFGCIAQAMAVGEEDLTEAEQPTEQTEQQVTQQTTEPLEIPTEQQTEEIVTEATTEMTEPTTVEETTEATEAPTEVYSDTPEETTEGNPWDFEVPTEGNIEAEQTKADYFTGTVMWSAVGGGLLILLIMFIGKRKY